MKCNPRRSQRGKGASWLLPLLTAMLVSHSAHAELSEDARASAYEIEASSGSVRFYNDALAEESQSQLPRAKQSLELALSIAENEKNVRAQAIVLERLSRVLEQTQQIISSRTRMEKACELRARAKDDVGELVCLERLGPMYLKSINANKAQHAYERLRKLAKKFEDDTLIAESWLGAGRASVLGRRIGPATRELDKALELFQKLGAPDRVADVYLAQAELARVQEQFDQSYALGLKAQQLLPDRTDIALVLIEDALVLGREEEVLSRLARFSTTSLSPVQQLQLSLVTLVVHTAESNQTSLERSARLLFEAFTSLPAAQDTPPEMGAVKRFLRQEKRMSPEVMEALNGVIKILGAEHTSVTELALKKQVDLLISTTRARKK